MSKQRTRRMIFTLTLDVDLDGMELEYSDTFDGAKAAEHIRTDLIECTVAVPYAHAVKLVSAAAKHIPTPTA